MRRQARQAMGVGALLAMSVAVACSSFGADAEPGTPTGTEGGADVTGADGSSPEAPTCPNIDTDSANCGRCGHDCQGGACLARRCQPIEIARFSDEPVATVVLSATHVFWNTIQSLAGGSGNVYSCPKTGCLGAPSPLSHSGNTIRGLGSDGDRRTYGGAFYAGGGLFEAAPSTLSRVLTTAQAGHPMQMSVRPEAMFFVSFYDPGNDRPVRRWDYVGTVTTPCSFTTAETTAAATFTAARVYLYANGTRVLYSCPLFGTGGQFAAFRTSLSLESLTATADRVFWTEDGLVRSSPDGPTSNAVQTELGIEEVGSKVTSVTVTGGDLFATTAGGELWSCAPDKCKTTLVRLAEDGLLESSIGFVSHTVAADANAVYYVAVDGTPDGGQRTSRLMKVAR